LIYISFSAIIAFFFDAAFIDIFIDAILRHFILIHAYLYLLRLVFLRFSYFRWCHIYAISRFSPFLIISPLFIDISFDIDFIFHFRFAFFLLFIISLSLIHSSSPYFHYFDYALFFWLFTLFRFLPSLFLIIAIWCCRFLLAFLADWFLFDYLIASLDYYMITARRLIFIAYWCFWLTLRASLASMPLFTRHFRRHYILFSCLRLSIISDYFIYAYFRPLMLMPLFAFAHFAAIRCRHCYFPAVTPIDISATLSLFYFHCRHAFTFFADHAACDTSARMIFPPSRFNAAFASFHCLIASPLSFRHLPFHYDLPAIVSVIYFDDAYAAFFICIFAAFFSSLFAEPGCFVWRRLR